MLTPPPSLPPCQDVLRGAAEEVLAVLKNDRLKDPERQSQVEALLGPVPGEKFAGLKAFSKGGSVRGGGRGESALDALPPQACLGG